MLRVRSENKTDPPETTGLWRNASLFVLIPGCIVFGAYAYKIESAHHAHTEHVLEENNGELPPRAEYSYLNLRHKQFPWGNQSLFFNPEVNYPAPEE